VHSTQLAGTSGCEHSKGKPTVCCRAFPSHLLLTSSSPAHWLVAACVYCYFFRARSVRIRNAYCICEWAGSRHSESGPDGATGDDDRPNGATWLVTMLGQATFIFIYKNDNLLRVPVPSKPCTSVMIAIRGAPSTDCYILVYCYVRPKKIILGAVSIKILKFNKNI